MTSSEYSAHCESETTAGWRASVEDVPCEVYAKRLDKLREEVAQQIHQATGIDVCEIVVRLEGIFPEAVSRFERAHDEIARANEIRDAAAREIRAVVAELRDEQLTVRDIGALLGITPQRVSQLIQTASTPQPTRA
jgi:DNA-directed RNA polymerase specialized sigma subunit